MTDASQTTTYTPVEPFLAEHKRRPTARRDGIAAWLRDEIAYLESIKRTEFGNGALSAYRSALRELETDQTTDAPQPEQSVTLAGHELLLCLVCGASQYDPCNRDGAKPCAWPSGGRPGTSKVRRGFGLAP